MRTRAHGWPESTTGWQGVEQVAEMRERLATLEAQDRYIHGRLEGLAQTFHNLSAHTLQLAATQDQIQRDLRAIQRLEPTFERMRRELERRNRIRKLGLAMLQYGTAIATIIGVLTGAVSGEQAAALLKGLFGAG